MNILCSNKTYAVNYMTADGHVLGSFNAAYDAASNNFNVVISSYDMNGFMLNKDDAINAFKLFIDTTFDDFDKGSQLIVPYNNEYIAPESVND